MDGLIPSNVVASSLRAASKGNPNNAIAIVAHSNRRLAEELSKLWTATQEVKAADQQHKINAEAQRLQQQTAQLQQEYEQEVEAAEAPPANLEDMIDPRLMEGNEPGAQAMDGVFDPALLAPVAQAAYGHDYGLHAQPQHYQPQPQHQYPEGPLMQDSHMTQADYMHHQHRMPNGQPPTEYNHQDLAAQAHAQYQYQQLPVR